MTQFSRKDLEACLDDWIRNSKIHSWELLPNGSIVIRPIKACEHISISCTVKEDLLNNLVIEP